LDQASACELTSLGAKSQGLCAHLDPRFDLTEGCQARIFEELARKPDEPLDLGRLPGPMVGPGLLEASLRTQEEAQAQQRAAAPPKRGQHMIGTGPYEGFLEPEQNKTWDQGRQPERQCQRESESCSDAQSENRGPGRMTIVHAFDSASEVSRFHSWQNPRQYLRMVPMVRRIFTPAQANRTLPLVRKIVRDILEAGQRLRALAATIHERGGRPEGDERERFEAIKDELGALMHELEAIGCTYKDWGFELGLVDFPARIDGQAVLLCWRSDESEVLWYHGNHDGFAGRRAIPAHLLAETAGSEGN